jgi:hypothetical protein
MIKQKKTALVGGFLELVWLITQAYLCSTAVEQE